MILMLEEKKKEGTTGNLSFTQKELQNAIHAGNIMAVQVLQAYGCTFPEITQLKRVIDEIPYGTKTKI